MPLFYLNQKHLPTANMTWQLMLFNVINLGLIILLASWPFPKHFNLIFWLIALLGLLLMLLLVVSPISRPKPMVTVSFLALTLLISFGLAIKAEQWIGVLLAVTSLLVLLPFIFPTQFQNKILKLSFQFLLAPFFFLTAQLFSAIHFLPETLLYKIALCLFILFCIELTGQTHRLAVIGYLLWIGLVIVAIGTHLVHGWQLILFAGAQLLLLATHLKWLKNLVILQELYYLLFIIGLFLSN